MKKTRHPKIFIGKIAAWPEEKVARTVERLSLLAAEGQETELRQLLSRSLSDADPDCDQVASVSPMSDLSDQARSKEEACPQIH